MNKYDAVVCQTSNELEWFKFFTLYGLYIYKFSF